MKIVTDEVSSSIIVASLAAGEGPVIVDHFGYCMVWAPRLEAEDLRELLGEPSEDVLNGAPQAVGFYLPDTDPDTVLRTMTDHLGY
ncbi:MAG: hypothetical protein HYW89_01850 [Candidatus Sungiibacteriota bacterium]|uniref:Uncharacterized protein n=1 Tax=Candidatus Sungiibacteriota bacterium TaxID=2750080 RepID=A0A7T5RK53_9BACT|nr:MAG: hypothetical protein HYW89_01850 [Candidatus Sungbacteria bacterium]